MIRQKSSNIENSISQYQCRMIKMIPINPLTLLCTEMTHFCDKGDLWEYGRLFPKLVRILKLMGRWNGFSVIWNTKVEVVIYSRLSGTENIHKSFKTSQAQFFPPGKRGKRILLSTIKPHLSEWPESRQQPPPHPVLKGISIGEYPKSIKSYLHRVKAKWSYYWSWGPRIWSNGYLIRWQKAFQNHNTEYVKLPINWFTLL